MEIGVVLPTRNDGPVVRRAIRDIDSQSYQPEKIVVVDDSDDQTRDIVTEDERVEVVCGDGTGIASALNKGLDYLETDLVARMDADDRCSRDRFEKQVEAMNNEGFDIVGTGAVINGPIGTTIRRPPAHLEHRMFHEKNHLIHGSVMARRTCFMEVGGYDESFPTSEDLDLWLRASKKFDIGNVPEPLYELNLRADSIYGERLLETKLMGIRAMMKCCGKDPGTNLESIKEHLSAEDHARLKKEMAMERLRYGDRRGSRRLAMQALLREPTCLGILCLSLAPDSMVDWALNIYRRLE